MQTVLPDEFKRGMLLLLDTIPHLIEDSHTSGTAQTRHKLHVRLRNLKTGNVIERTFAENERVAIGALEHHTVQFSYKQGETYTFVDTKTFEEVNLPAELSIMATGGHISFDTRHVPLVFKAPGVKGGSQVDQKVFLTDIAPTVYRALGWATPSYVDGKPLPMP